MTAAGRRPIGTLTCAGPPPDLKNTDGDPRRPPGAARPSPSFCRVKHRGLRKLSPRIELFFRDVTQRLPRLVGLRDNRGMGFWSWLRALWPPPSGAAASNRDDDASAAEPDDDPPAPTDARVKAATAPAGPDSAPGRILAGTIDDYNGQAQIGLITLADGALIGFGSEACEEFTPLIGLRVAIHGTGVPPEAALRDPGELPGLWALRVRLWPGSESEYAARLRIHQVERALRGAGERGESAPGEPPWARGKNRPGRKPSGPGRPWERGGSGPLPGRH